MPHNESTGSPQSRTQSIEELQKRFKKLDEARIAADANQKTAQARMNELNAGARDTYGTDDIDALKKQRTEMITENERARSAYQAALDAVEGELAEVERAFADAAAKAAEDESRA